MVYKLLVGKHPSCVRGKDTTKTLGDKIRRMRDIALPSKLEVSPMMRDLVSRLCRVNQVERYDATECLRHPALTGSTAIPPTLRDQISELSAQDD